MNVRNVAVAVAAVFLLLAPVGISAQQRTVTSGNAVELDPEDPRGKRAAALATVLAGKDAAEAEKYLKTHAVPDSPAATDIAKQVKELQTALAGGLSVDRIVGGQGDDVMVLLTSTSGARGGRMALLVQVETKAPHRIREVRTMQGRRQQGGF